MRSSSSFPIRASASPSIHRGAGLARGGLARTSTRFSASGGELPPSFLQWWVVEGGGRASQRPEPRRSLHQGAPSIDWVVPHLERVSCPSWSLWIWHHLSSWPSISPSSATTVPPAPTSRSPPFSRFPLSSDKPPSPPRFIYLFLYGYAGPSLPLRPFSRGEQGLACSGSGGLLAVVAALGGAQTLGRLGASSCRSWAPQLWRTRLVLHGMWDLSGPGFDPCLLLCKWIFYP